MINAKQSQACPREIHFSSVRETVAHAARDSPLMPENTEKYVPADFPQCQHGTRPQQVDLPPEVVAAIQNFRGKRFVARWRAACSGCYVRIVKLQAVIGPLPSRLIRKSRVV